MYCSCDYIQIPSTKSSNFINLYVFENQGEILLLTDHGAASERFRRTTGSTRSCIVYCQNSELVPTPIRQPIDRENSVRYRRAGTSTPFSTAVSLLYNVTCIREIDRKREREGDERERNITKKTVSAMGETGISAPSSTAVLLFHNATCVREGSP